MFHTLQPYVRSLTGLIADFYALNVADDGAAWACYYTDFPLVRFGPSGSVTVLGASPVHGAHAMALGADRALFAGCYRNHDTLFLWAIASGMVASFAPSDAAGQKIVWRRAAGRADKLYLLDGCSLYLVPFPREPGIAWAEPRPSAQA